MTFITRQVLESPASSYWLKNALRSALERDPLDALADAEHLVACLKLEWERLVEGVGSR